LFDHLKLERVHLVGTSLGGWIAADLAHRCCHRLASLTLVAPSGLRLAGVQQVDAFLRTEEQALRDSFHNEAKAAAAATRMLAPETEDARLQNAIAIARVSWNPRLHDPQLAKWLHRISTPTLIVWGEDDRLFPKPYAEAWRKAIPGARLELLKACGHAVALEEPDALVDRIFDFTGKLRSAA
jgi:pimeloyl-ACP methyl ester carboxylesterase